MRQAAPLADGLLSRSADPPVSETGSGAGPEMRIQTVSDPEDRSARTPEASVVPVGDRVPNSVSGGNFVCRAGSLLWGFPVNQRDGMSLDSLFPADESEPLGRRGLDRNTLRIDSHRLGQRFSHGGDIRLYLRALQAKRCNRRCLCGSLCRGAFRRYARSRIRLSMPLNRSEVSGK